MPGSYGPLATIRRERRQLTKVVAEAEKELQGLNKAEQALLATGGSGRSAANRGRVAKANRSTRTTRRRGRRRAGATAE